MKERFEEGPEEGFERERGPPGRSAGPSRRARTGHERRTREGTPRGGGASGVRGGARRRPSRHPLRARSSETRSPLTDCATDAWAGLFEPFARHSWGARYGPRRVHLPTRPSKPAASYYHHPCLVGTSKAGVWKGTSSSSPGRLRHESLTTGAHRPSLPRESFQSQHPRSPPSVEKDPYQNHNRGQRIMTWTRRLVNKFPHKKNKKRGIQRQSVFQGQERVGD